LGHLVNGHDGKQLGVGIWLDDDDPQVLQLSIDEFEAAAKSLRLVVDRIARLR
jgi:hypothetical protein